MRADRLIAVLLLLQNRGRLTAAEVARELEVSERTARRDLEALSMSGVPVYSTHGRGGGWQLIGDARTDLTGLSANEAQALFLAAGSALDHSPELTASLKSGLRKLTSALPETFRSDAEAAAAAIKVDTTGWGQSDAEENVHFLDILMRAVVLGRQIRMRYPGSNAKGQSDRVVHPLGLVSKRTIWYLIADTPRGLRTFRLTRVEHVEVLAEPVVRPDGFDLDAAWDDVVAAMESKRPSVRVEILADPDMIGPLRYTFGANCRFDPPGDDGRVPVVIEDWTEVSLAAQLAGFGSSIEMLNAPDGVAGHLRRIAHELAAVWDA